jgi:predicted porin
MKKLLAIAIAAGMAAPAIADTTLYGTLHASVDVLSADGDGKGNITTVSSNKSLIGVKGSSALNAGLKLIYKAEFSIDAGGGNSSPKKSGAFGERNQFIGVKGDFGAVLIGRHDTPMKIIGRKADLFWSSQIGQNRSLVNNKVDGVSGLDLRTNNFIAYQSPKIGGFQMLVAYASDLEHKEKIAGVDTATLDNDSDLFSINGLYKAGPLTLGAAFEKRDIVTSTTTIENDAIRLMGSYKFGAAKVVAFYQNQDVDTAGVTTADEDVYGIGGSYKISPLGTVKAQYYKLENDIGVDNEADLFAVGYDHKLGKSTHVYAQYATLGNDDGARLSLGGSGHGEKITPSTGGDADAISIGIRHKF